jgi:hypothetical protein
VVLEHIEGETYSEGLMPAAADVDAAVDFFCKLNADRRTAHQMIKLAAAEGFMSLTEHLANVNHRLALMTTEELPNATKLKAKALLCALRLSLEQVADKIKGLIDDGVVADAVTREELCVSPSDFGFHNAIRTPTCMKFIDFEFAGWDDPAKAVSDFALQPRVPTYSQSLQLLSAVPRRQAALVEQRCAALGPLLRLKWACIIAAVLNPEKLRQLSGMCPTPDPSVLIHQRIEHAFRYLQQEAPFGLH